MRNAVKAILTIVVLTCVVLTPGAKAEDDRTYVSSTSSSTTTTNSTDGSVVGPDPPGQGCRPTCR